MGSDTEEVENQEVSMEQDSSDSDSNEGEEELLEKRAIELESEILTNPYAYNAYVELVGVYKKLLNLTEMRKSYERFYKYYPLTGQLWLDWIKDEIKIANTENEKKYIIGLFDKAVEDYLSIDLWLEYVQFSVGFETDFTRKVFEKAVNVAGLHFQKSSLIWDAYREYELALLSGITDIESEAWKKQVIKVNEIFKRQLSVSLLDMDRTFVEWRVWVEKLPKNDFIDRESVNWAYKSSTKYLDDYLDFEDKLSEATDDSKRLEIYYDYIDDTRKLEHIQCLYERAIAEFSLNGELWLNYCMYHYKLGNYEAALKTCDRALRNCYDTDLWVLNIRILEIVGKNHDEITEFLEKALAYQLDGQAYLQIWLAYMDHFRRITDPKITGNVEKLRNAFEKGLKYLMDNYGFEVDPDCSFLRYWAKIEVNFLKDITACRTIWNDYGILKTLGSTANSWLELINLELEHGDDKHIRKTYQRALTSTKDWPQSIVQSWILYERQFGTADSIITTTETCRKFMKKWNLDNPIQAEQYEGQNEELRNKSNEKKRKYQNKNDQKETIQNDRKRKQEQRSSMENEQKHVKISHESPDKNNVHEDDKSEESKKEFEKVDQFSEKQIRTIFLSNIDFSVTEEQLKEFIGSFEELRLVKDKKGVSRGYAYCVCSSVEDAQKNLKRDRELLNSRPIFISKCNADKQNREHYFQYQTSRENNKLFVRGLPLTMTQEEVEELFKPHGELKQVRLVTYRSGTPKGLAYVDFKDANDAAKAVIAIDNTKVRGFTISVAISHPPKRQFDNFTPAQDISRHSRSRIEFSLVPQSVQKKLLKKETNSMTNEDFRKMLNKN